MNIAETPTIAKPMLADGACNLLAKPLHESTIERMNNWLKSNADGFTNKNEKYNLKVGDVITFKNGYDIPMRTKIIAFNAENGNPYMYWDCYWVDLDLEKRLIKTKNNIGITDKILKLNEKANLISSMQNEIIESIEKLNKEKSFVFGYRASCGSTDRTMKVFRIWCQALKEFEKQVNVEKYPNSKKSTIKFQIVYKVNSLNDTE